MCVCDGGGVAWGEGGYDAGMKLICATFAGRW